MSHTYFGDISERPVAAPRHQSLYVRGGKRLFDIVAVLLVAPIVMPVVLGVWAATYMAGRTGFYRQLRVGRGGGIFKCWKIRTMAVDADNNLADFLEAHPAAALEWRTTQKLVDDPRITKFGQFLRASSIDELPQFWNVLKGEMSLIGPRPFTPDQKALYDAASVRKSYYAFRPGLSGLWQIKSRNTGEFCDRVTYDEEYADNISLIYDIKIALHTVGVVLRATGK